MKNFDTWSIPAHRQIDFETPSQVLGIEGVLISSSTIYTLAFRTRQLSYRVPKYISPDPHPALSVGDSVSISFPPQRMVSGRIDGYALSGASFLRMASATFGFIAERTAAPPQSDEMTIRPSGRIRPSSDALITDLRRFRTPMGSFSGFTALTQVVYHGPCFFRIFSLFARQCNRRPKPFLARRGYLLSFPHGHYAKCPVAFLPWGGRCGFAGCCKGALLFSPLDGRFPPVPPIGRSAGSIRFRIHSSIVDRGWPGE